MSSDVQLSDQYQDLSCLKQFLLLNRAQTLIMLHHLADRVHLLELVFSHVGFWFQSPLLNLPLTLFGRAVGLEHPIGLQGFPTLLAGLPQQLLEPWRHHPW